MSNIIEEQFDDGNKKTINGEQFDDGNKKTINDGDISFDHTLSTIQSIADEPSQNLIFDSFNGDTSKKKRRNSDLISKDTDFTRMASNNVFKKDTTEAKRSKSILHTYPVQHTSATEKSIKLTQALKEIYHKDVLPIEEKFDLYDFCLPTNAEIQDSEFDAKPMVLLLGQYSTGKTTFIRHLIGRDFPAMHIGPEPTTDRFMALVHGEDEDEESDSYNSEFHDYDNDASNNIKLPTDAWTKDGQNKSSGRILKGNSLTVVPELPFSTLSKFGSGFLSHFVGSISAAPLLQHVTLIDTPGVLSGEKQRLSRSYDFAQAAKWFADRSDLILLLFDAHKLDISDELKDVVETIRPNNDDKMRCILNKADGVTREQLVRVYGSLMWSMGKIFRTPEVVRVYTGSYWDQDLMHEDFKGMFEKDEFLLINELLNLPKSCAERKVNELVKRIRIIKVHLCILTHLKKNTPKWFGKKKAMEKMIDNLVDVFDSVGLEHKLSAGDFPDIDEFKMCLKDLDDFSELIAADKRTLRKLDSLIMKDIPAIMKGVIGLNAPITPVKDIKTKQSSSVVTDTEQNEENELNELQAGISFDSVGMVDGNSKTDTITPLMMISALITFGIYILFYVIVTQVGHENIPLPLIVIRHFLLIERFIKTHIFDSFPSGESLV